MINQFQKVLISLAIACLLFSLTGCYSRTEIEETAFIVSWGLEKGEQKKYKMIIQVAVPAKFAGESGGGGEDEPYWLTTAEADTILEGIKELNKRSSRVLHFSHAEALIISEEIAREGIAPIIDAITRNSEMRPDMSILITSDPIEDILKVAYPLEDLVSTYIQRLQGQQARHEQAVPFEVDDTYTKMQPGFEAAIPRLKIWEEKKPQEPKKEQQAESENPSPMPADQGNSGGGGSGSAGGQQKEPPKELIIEGAAIFRGDKMVGWINGQEVNALKWIRKEVTDGPIFAKVDDTQYSLRVREFYQQRQVKPNLKDLGSSTLDCRIKLETDLWEIAKTNKLPDNKELESLSKILSDQIEKDINQLIQKAKYELRSDFLGYGEAIRRKAPYQVWQKAKKAWNQEFQNLIVNVQVEVVVRRLGMTIQSPNLP